MGSAQRFVLAVSYSFMDIQRQFVQFAGFEVNEYFIFFDLENRGRNFRNVDESFQILCVGYRVGEYDFNSVFRLVDAYGGQEAETVLCRDQNTFVLGRSMPAGLPLAVISSW